jgi:hypothetical protein
MSTSGQTGTGGRAHIDKAYLVDRGSDPSVLDGGTLEAHSDETAGAILRESARLPEREKEMVLGIVRQF